MIEIPIDMLTTLDKYPYTHWAVDASDLEANGIPYSRQYSIDGWVFDFAHRVDQFEETLYFIYRHERTGQTLRIYND